MRLWIAERFAVYRLTDGRAGTHSSAMLHILRRSCSNCAGNACREAICEAGFHSYSQLTESCEPCFDFANESSVEV